MSLRRALLLAITACVTRSAVAAVPIERARPVNSASPTSAVSGEATPTVRQFAVLSELGALRIRKDAAKASLLGASAEPAAAPEGCALSGPGAASVPSAACLRCHPRQGHPVDLSYAVSYSRASWSLRPEEEVVRRGVLLPQGRLECVTCHDGRSPWKYKIALPPGAPAVPVVVTGHPETYGNGGAWRTARASSVPALPPGTQVTASPLCAACHTNAD